LVFVLGVLAICDVVEAVSAGQSERVRKSGNLAIREEVGETHEHARDSHEDQTTNVSGNITNLETETPAARQQCGTASETGRAGGAGTGLTDCVTSSDQVFEDKDRATSNSKAVKPLDQRDVETPIHDASRAISPD
jgi:hypothetical protein